MISRWLILPLGLLFAQGCATTVSDFDFDVPTVTADSAPVPLFRAKMGNAKKPRGPILIPVKFNDHVEQCMLDTGSAGSIVMANDFFKSLPNAGRGWITGVSGHWQPAFKVSSKRVEIGGRIWEDAVFTLSDEENIKRMGFSCLIGMNLLAGSTLHFDFKRSVFEMLREIPVEHVTEALTLTRAGDIVVPVRIGSRDAMAVWDSGAEVTSVDIEAIKADPESFHYMKTFASLGVDSTGRQFDMPIYSTNRLEIAGHRLPLTPVQGLDLRLARNVHPTLLLGLDLMTKYNWYFDLVHRRWLVE